jgi:iron complex outermembrane receptor protein
VKRYVIVSAVAGAVLARPAFADNVLQLPGMNISAITEAPFQNFQLEADTLPAAAPDSADLLRRAPGANVNANGPLTGIVQYRGMYGDRLNVLVDGINIAPGGPNAMDPPLSYIPRERLKDIVVVRGIAPVSSGDETIGGTIIANSKEGHFTAGKQFQLHGNAEAGAYSVDDGYSVSGMAALSNESQRMHVAATHTAGDDRDFSGGTITPSRYERNVYDVGYGLLSGEQELGLDYQRNETGETGTPALPMDIIFINTNIVRSDFKGALGDIQIGGKLYHTDVDHKMDNYTLRRPTNPMMLRFTRAKSDGTGYDLHVAMPLAAGKLALGTDGLLASHDADIFDPNNSNFFVNNFHDVRRNRYGFFSEWNAKLANRWGLQLGARYTRVDMDSGSVDATPAHIMAAAGTLRDRFNAADLSRGDDNFDWVAKLDYAIRKDLRMEVGLARKTRSPSYQEAYLWLPLQSTGGLADGNNYVGNPNLDPEVAHEAEVGLDWRSGGAYLSPRAFYRSVDNYIQGVPATDPAVIMFSTGNGDPTPLQFANVAARFYGVDAEWGVPLAENWSLDGVISYVRGQRRDIDDNLYRIAPLNTTVDLTHRRERWSFTLEGMFYAAQHDVSATNGETPSAGYGLMNLFGRYKLPRQNITFGAGIDNVLNKHYEPHLGGINRVTGSDVALGAHLPGDGINGYVNVSLNW